MDLRHLRYFVAVAEELHFGRAAERLNMAQPPLSQAIRRLEHELGVDLLHRTTRRVDLTDAGRSYLVRARQILGEVDEAAHEARRVAAYAVGHLAIGCVGSATYSLLPALSRGLSWNCPESTSPSAARCSCPTKSRRCGPAGSTWRCCDRRSPTCP